MVYRKGELSKGTMDRRSSSQRPGLLPCCSASASRSAKPSCRAMATGPAADMGELIAPFSRQAADAE